MSTIIIAACIFIISIMVFITSIFIDNNTLFSLSMSSIFCSLGLIIGRIIKENRKIEIREKDMKTLLIIIEISLLIAFVLIPFDVIRNKYIIGSLFIIQAVLLAVLYFYKKSGKGNKICNRKHIGNDSKNSIVSHR